MKKLMILVAALALVAASAMTAAAADWNFYGSARVATFYVDRDLADTDGYEQGLQGNSRIGANVKVSDELTGRFEYGTGVNTRILWGEWNFGAGSLGVGQHYTPLNMFYSNQVYGSDNGLLAQGGVYSGRESMVRLKFGGFEIAALAPNAHRLGTGLDTQVDYPGIEASYVLKMDAVSMHLAGGFQSYELNGRDVDSWVVALGAKAGFGAVWVAGNVYAGENAGNMIFISVDGDNAWDDGRPAYDAVNNRIIDNDAWGFLIAAGFNVNDMFGLEAGFGYAQTEFDVAGSNENEVMAYYLQAPITLAPGVFLVPEIGRFDGDETGSEELTYFGAKWQINF